MTLPITTGIELELWVTDRRGALADGREVCEAHERIEEEFIPCLIEVKTEPHDTEAGLRKDLYVILGTAVEKAAMNDLRLVPMGTPLGEAQPKACTARGRLFERIYGSGITPSKNCAGTHVHFEQDRVGRQLNLLTALDPALGLVSSSPYYCGDRDVHCSRAVAYRTGCDPAFREFCGLMEYADDADEWRNRVDRRFERFCELAERQGVSRERVTDHFSPADTVLNPVRLQDSQPTVEWRAPDATLPSHAVTLAVDAARLVGATARKEVVPGERGVTDDRIGVPEFDRLRTLSRHAIRSGCRAGEVRRYLRSLGFDVGKYAPVAQQVAGSGTLTDAEARRLRLNQSKRLAADLPTLTDRTADDQLECPTVRRVRDRAAESPSQG